MSETSIFDKTVYLDLVSELGREDTVEVLKAFLADTSRKMEVMASVASDRSTLKREAHSIKSSSATFGFFELSALARKLEAVAETLTIAELLESVVALRQAFERTSQLAQTRLLTADSELA